MTVSTVARKGPLVMKATHFDAKTGNEFPAYQASGLAGFTSWVRLSKIFRDAGEVRPDEELLSFQVDDRGITFRVKQTLR